MIGRVPFGTSKWENARDPYRILAAREDAQAGVLLAAAYVQLQSLAGKIIDKQLRHSFWHAVPAHRQLRALWEQAAS